MHSAVSSIGLQINHFTGLKVVRAQSWVHVRFGVDELALRYFFSPEYFGFPLSVRFYQCSILTFIFTALLREIEVGVAREPSDNAVLLRILGSIRQKSTSNLFNKLTYLGKSSRCVNYSKHKCPVWAKCRGLLSFFKGRKIDS
jgi:hypothetical protein